MEARFCCPKTTFDTSDQKETIGNFEQYTTFEQEPLPPLPGSRSNLRNFNVNVILSFWRQHIFHIYLSLANSFFFLTYIEIKVMLTLVIQVLLVLNVNQEIIRTVVSLKLLSMLFSDVKES